jgi:acyl carrier protein
VPASEYSRIVDVCREVVSSEHGLALSTICLLKTRSVPKTTSGKIARAWCKRGLLEGSLSILYRWDGGESLPGSNPDGALAAAAEADDDGSIEIADDGTGSETQKLMKRVTASEIRSMSHEELLARLEFNLIRVASHGVAELQAPVDPAASLVSLGLDSMTIVQFKGILESRFHSNIPDEFLFTGACSLSALVLAVSKGELTDEQKEMLASGVVEETDEHGNTTTTVIPKNKEPLCPWFTCCY